MDADFQINQELNRMIGEVTEKSVIRLGQLRSFPLCILYGEIPDSIGGMLRMELAARTGSFQAAEVVAVTCAEEMETSVTTAIHRLQGRIGYGELPRRNHLYIAFLFMVDKLNVRHMQDCFQQFVGLMQKFGYKKKYEVCYYCIFDYELAKEGGRYKEAVQELLQNKDTNFSVGIFTHTWAAASGERYMKAVQAIAMHIFLKCARETIADYAIFTLAYWKRDVLKNGIADYLIRFLEMQERRQEEDRAYNERIAEVIDKRTHVRFEDYSELFRCFPVCVDNLRRGEHIPEELSKLLYGTKDAFRRFLEDDMAGEWNQGSMEQILEEDAGNLYAIRNQLQAALEEYIRGKDMGWQQGQKALPPIRIKSMLIQNAVKEAVKGLGELWKYDVNCFSREYPLKCAQALLDCLGSERFQEKIQIKEEEIRAQIAQLHLVQRESLNQKGNGIYTQDYFQDIEYPRVSWNQAIWSDSGLRQIEGTLKKRYSQALEQIHLNQTGILAEYAMCLRELKMKDALCSYYAARLDEPADSQEAEYLYTGSIPENIDQGQLQKLLRTHLPKVHIRAREWEPDTCLEHFAVKEIIDFSEVYAID